MIREYTKSVGINLEQNLSVENRSPEKEKLIKRIDEIHGLQTKSIEALKKQIQAASEYDENADSKMSFGEMLKSIFEWVSAITSGEWERMDALLKGMKLDSKRSDTNEFSMTYKEKDGEEPTEENIFAMMK